MGKSNQILFLLWHKWNSNRNWGMVLLLYIQLPPWPVLFNLGQHQILFLSPCRYIGSLFCSANVLQSLKNDMFCVLPVCVGLSMTTPAESDDGFNMFCFFDMFVLCFVFWYVLCFAFWYVLFFCVLICLVFWVLPACVGLSTPAESDDGVALQKVWW